MKVDGDRVRDGETTTEDLELWMRDPVECVKEMIENPAFKGVYVICAGAHVCR